MTEKISIFDVEISCIKAKEAMMQAIGFHERRYPVNTIGTCIDGISDERA